VGFLCLSAPNGKNPAIYGGGASRRENGGWGRSPSTATTASSGQGSIPGQIFRPERRTRPASARTPAKRIDLLPNDEIFCLQLCSRPQERSQDAKNRLGQISHQADGVVPASTVHAAIIFSSVRSFIQRICIERLDRTLVSLLAGQLTIPQKEGCHARRQILSAASKCVSLTRAVDHRYSIESALSNDGPAIRRYGIRVSGRAKRSSARTKDR
jgi:hypothetical protein